MTLLSKIFGGAAAATALAGGIYAYSALYSHNGSEFKIVMNKGNAVSVSSEGLGFAWGWYDRVHSFPRTRQITSVEDNEVTLRSQDGEEFIGGIRVEYQFTFRDGAEHEEANKVMISNLFRDFNIQDTGSFWDTNAIDPVEKTVNARAKTAAVSVFAGIKTDEYQSSIDQTRLQIRDRLQQIVDAEGLPIRIVEVDTSGVSPHPDVQARINRIASERRENERAQVTIDNAELVQEAAKKEAQATMEFANALRNAGYSEETIVILNCQRLADRADRFGIPFGVNCNGGSNGVAVAVDPRTVGRPEQDAAPAARPTPAP